MGSPSSTPALRVRLLPSPAGWIFLAILAALLLCSLNYGLSVGFLLSFMLMAMAMNAGLRTWLNLRGLRATLMPAASPHAGGIASFPVRLENPARRLRHAVRLRYGAWSSLPEDLPPAAVLTMLVPVPAPKRGVLRSGGRLRLVSRYPLGLFEARLRLPAELSVLVYPRVSVQPFPPTAQQPAHADANQRPSDDGDYTGLRDYRPGDPIRHLSWKALARQGKAMTKQFTDAAAEQRWLDWAQCHAVDDEERLSLLCRGVLDLQSAGDRYGLKLPGLAIEPGSGVTHAERCLRALALHGSPA